MKLNSVIRSTLLLTLLCGAELLEAQYGIGTNFLGLGVADTSGVAPPDSNAAAGLNDIVEVVNTELAVFDKVTGVELLNAPLNSLWTAGDCANNASNYDPVVRYDRAANRWIMTQATFPASGTASLCLAISRDSDPLDGFTGYQYGTAYGFISAPKLGTWPDAYYVAYDTFDSQGSFLGPEVCALQRSVLIGGSQGNEVCFQPGAAYVGLLPSDLDSVTLPTSGLPNPVFGLASNRLLIWQFHVDFNNPGNSRLSGPIQVPVMPFTPACPDGPCVVQPGPQLLDGLGDRLMYRAAYHNFGSYDSILLNHSIQASNGVGVRWYEVRTTTGRIPFIFQQGTINLADSLYDWTGSAAMDKLGNIGFGYSESASVEYPSIYAIGHRQSDPPGTVDFPILVTAGAGSQSDNSRWGDYSSMSVDPSDDCTMWYTNEYLPSDGSLNWNTWIVSMKFDNCE